MRKSSLILLLVPLAAALPVAAQDLLPSSFSGWSSSGPAETLAPAALERVAAADAALLREDGIMAVERRQYSRSGATLGVKLYRMRDPSGAYAAFTFLRSEQMASTDLARFSGISADRAILVSGNLIVDVFGLKGASPSDLKELVAVLSPHADKTPYPPLADYLPARGLLRNSERYMLGPAGSSRVIPLGNGDWIGFAEGAEAQLARYRINGQEATLLLAVYPTPQAAARKLQELGRWFQLNPEQDAPPSATDPVFARRKGSLLSIVAFSRSHALANSLLDQIHYETQVTWNEPGYRLTGPSIAQILVGAIVGTGMLMLFALIAGISFGGVRLVVKYFFPGKVFDRAAHVEILQLGLSSKPIEAKDFY